MPRSTRLDFAGAIHYVQVHGQDGLEIFFDAATLKPNSASIRDHAPRLRQFEQLMTGACEECGTTLHGYCIEPNCSTLILQTAGAPLEAFMRRLCGPYAKYARPNGAKGRQSIFRSRYASKVISPEYLPHAVRRAHRRPIVSGLSQRRVDYPFSSERGHTGEKTAMPLNTEELKSALELKGHFGKRGYREFMDQADSPYVANLFVRGSPVDPRIVGGKWYVQHARRLAAHPSAPPTREDLIAEVARLLDTTPAAISCESATGVLGRALVAWYGLRSGAATLTEMGRWFSVTGATLGQAMGHHRRISPELFSLSVLRSRELGIRNSD